MYLWRRLTTNVLSALPNRETVLSYLGNIFVMLPSTIELSNRPITINCILETQLYDKEYQCCDSMMITQDDDNDTVVSCSLLIGDIKNKQQRRRLTQLGICVLGIYSSYLYYASLQEDVFTFVPTHSDEKFTFIWFLQFIEAFMNTLFAFTGFVIGSALSKSHSDHTSRLPRNLHMVDIRTSCTHAPIFSCAYCSRRTHFNNTSRHYILFHKHIYFSICGVAQVTSKACMSMSLVSGVSFPVAMLGKSAKCAPVMVAQLLSTKNTRYTTRQYIQVINVVLGTALVTIGSTQSTIITTKSSSSSTSTPFGLFFIFLSLVLDGITGGFQQKLKQYDCNHDDSKTSTHSLSLSLQFMLCTNFYMSLVAFIASFFIVQDGSNGWMYLKQHTEVARLIFRFA